MLEAAVLCLRRCCRAQVGGVVFGVTVSCPRRGDPIELGAIVMNTVLLFLTRRR
jgi:hypothetical protein